MMTKCITENKTKLLKFIDLSLMLEDRCSPDEDQTLTCLSISSSLRLSQLSCSKTEVSDAVEPRESGESGRRPTIASGCIQLGLVTVAVTGLGRSDVIFNSLKWKETVVFELRHEKTCLLHIQKPEDQWSCKRSSDICAYYKH